MSKTYRTDPNTDTRGRRPLEPCRRKAPSDWEQGGRGTRWMRGSWRDASFAATDADSLRSRQ